MQNLCQFESNIQESSQEKIIKTNMKNKISFYFGTFYIYTSNYMLHVLTKLFIVNTFLNIPACFQQDHYQGEFRWESLSSKNHLWWKIISS